MGPGGRITTSSDEDAPMNPTPTVGLLLVLGACAPIPSPDASPSSFGTSATASGTATDRNSIARGAVFAQARCSGCHAVGATGDSQLAAAPHFRDINRRNLVEQLAEAFAEGIVTAHPAMPEFVLTQDENRDLIIYLKSIQERSDRRTSGPAARSRQRRGLILRP